MPRIQRLSVRCADVEGRDLVLREAEWFCIGDIVVEERVDFVRVY